MSEPAPPQDAVASLERVLTTISYLLTRSQTHERMAARAGVGIGRSDLYLLMALESGGGVSRVGDLAARLLVEPSHVTRQIGQLAAQGLVDRTTDAVDRRVRQVAITERGTATLDRLRQASEGYLRQALRGAEEADVAATAAVLRQLVDHARTTVREEVAPPPPEAREPAARALRSG
ncbi:MarR family winged helix-turn-helix transcriptional regulator [Streptomyces palmae]|uniref:MarR family transcriptional regulator n=1 Tax=Streptomyces palmae TaxID=1701085 RepID=A0A4Z0HDW8_9ACTN|nr:MarR family transcriptional regulator [Streptomyces palmae]TGB13606.1 MarR family transcriptional regulator [Streptomyces palmae]